MRNFIDKLLKKTNSFYATLFLCCFSMCYAFSQTDDSNLFNAYKSYSKLPREVIYGHLNKSTLISGERLGFTIYAFDKYTKKSSKVTTNIYCSIEDVSGKIIKNKMILGADGIGSGTFAVDSLFSSGNYTFKAYTNWMKNFDEQNFYVQDIKIINPDDYNTSKKASSNALDAQFLPEGGHLISNIQNTIGAVIKNDQGLAIPNLKGLVYDSDGVEVTNFKTSALGISKFNLIPEDGKTYTVKLNSEVETTVTLPNAEAKGLNINLTDLGKKVALVFRTNTKTLPEIAGKTFKLSFSNGSQLKVIDINFNDKTEIAKLINYSDLFTGINIITLFDDKDKPVLERLFFKYDGIEQLTSGQETVKKTQDSLIVSIPLKGIDKTKFNNFSVSVLPEGTKSYNTHHNIISYTFLQPYVKGYIENAHYYFTDINRIKKLELDNLLLTQGWSAYNWDTIFKGELKANYAFENGLSLTANLNKTKSKQFIIYPLINSSTITMDVPKGENSFNIKGLLPYDDETINIGTIAKKDRVVKPTLYVQFSPSEIPSLDLSFTNLGYTENSAVLYSPNELILDDSWRDLETLDAVLITAKKDEERIERIKDRTPGRVDFLSDIQRDGFSSFGNYISSKGFNVIERGNILEITNTRRTNFGGASSPIIYLDKLLINDFSVLTSLDMSIVDYVVVDKSGIGEGFRGAGGVIKIFTDPQKRIERYNIDKEVGQQVKPPLAFSTTKQFYTPIYSSYRNEFYQNYGVIDWFPKVKIDINGVLDLKILNTKNDQIKLYIEGFANDGTFFVEEKTITID